MILLKAGVTSHMEWFTTRFVVFGVTVSFAASVAFFAKYLPLVENIVNDDF